MLLLLTPKRLTPREKRERTTLFQEIFLFLVSFRHHIFVGARYKSCNSHRGIETPKYRSFVIIVFSKTCSYFVLQFLWMIMTKLVLYIHIPLQSTEYLSWNTSIFKINPVKPTLVSPLFHWLSCGKITWKHLLSENTASFGNAELSSRRAKTCS